HAEAGIRDFHVTGVQTCALPISEADVAIAMAQAGGIGMLHKNMSIDAQAKEVRKVKRSESGMIQDPVVLHESALVRDAFHIMKEIGRASCRARGDRPEGATQDDT